MTTAWERLRASFGIFLTPVVQGAIGNAQITCDLGLRFPAPLHSLHRFQLEFLRKGALFFWHDALPLETLFQVYLLRESPSSPLTGFDIRRSMRPDTWAEKSEHDVGDPAPSKGREERGPHVS